MSARILLVGSGGREHALAWKLAQSPIVQHVSVVPGNGGTAGFDPKVSNVTGVSADRFDQLLSFALKEKITLLVPGPEAPLVDGITDYFKEHGPASISIFGPSKAAARMEGSKVFAKDFMKRHNIPTAEYGKFDSYADAKAFIDSHRDMKVVIKASGLAAGKGVIIPNSYLESIQALSSMMLDREFGAAGDSVVIEEFLEGEEISILSVSDGYTVRSLPAAQDHKRINDNDEGPNTGGMGCYAPTGVVTPELLEKVHKVIQSTIDAMRNERYPFVGCLFTGFMMTKSGPKVLEYNVRFGDPECQTLLPLLDSDLAEIMLACTGNYLSSINFKIKPQLSTTVVVAAGGYPGAYDKGIEMKLKETAKDTVLFHAGTAFNQTTNKLSTSGGRVIAATAIGSNILDAVEKAYKGVSCISFPKMHYRKDIAHHELARHEFKTGTSTANSTVDALTYASAGVSISAGNSLVERIKPLVKRTARPGTEASIGGFGGDIDLAAAGYHSSSPTIIGAIDGIGTKLKIATEVGDFSTIGIDLVAMNVNDLIVQGAEPLAFLDYYACSHLNVDAASSFVAGVAEGCILADCGLIGGETAEMPSVYNEGEFDAAGCAIGALAPESKILPDKRSMREGDVLLGLASSGCHSNGFSLIRKIVERTGLRYNDPAPWENAGSNRKTVGQSLLTPTRIYVKSLLTLVGKGGANGSIKGMAHITGGGLIDNIPRMLPDYLAAELSVSTWPMPPVLQWLKKAGQLESREFATTFNTGLGMVLVVSNEEAEGAIDQLRKLGEEVFKVGLLKRTSPSAERVELKDMDIWDQN